MKPEVGNLLEKPIEKEKERLVIERIYQWTHPDFDSRVWGRGRRLPKHEELRNLGGDKLREIERDPNAILFYVSMYRAEIFQNFYRWRRGQEIDPELKLEMGDRALGITEELNRLIEIKKEVGTKIYDAF